MRRKGKIGEKSEKNNGKTGERERLSELVCRYLGVAPDFLPSESMIEIRGRSYIMVHGAGKIIYYTPEEIRIRLKKSSLSVKGRGLVCISYHVDSVGIEGKISDLCFLEEE